MTQTRPSACPLDCPDGCSLSVTVTEGRVTALTGDRRNPATQGLICGKVRGFAKQVYGPTRIQTPARRVGKKGEGRFEPISWDEALDTIVSRFRACITTDGASSILPCSYGGSNGWLSEGTIDRRLFHRLGASRLSRSLCGAPTGRAHSGLYGRMPGVDIRDLVHSRLIVLWGFNPNSSGIHLVPVIKDVKSNGGKLVVIDPRTTPLAKLADLHLPIRPGTDLPLALSVITWLFDEQRADLAFLERHTRSWQTLRDRAAQWTLAEAAAECGIEPHEIEQFAQLYANTSPTVIRLGYGLERNRNGGSASAAILALPAIAGKFGAVGGGFYASTSGTFALDPDTAIGAAEPATRIVNLAQLGRALTDLTDPPVKALFVYDCNPVSTLPLQQQVRAGLEREDLFTVVFDQVTTDTALYADILLPATTFLEHDDLTLSYGTTVAHRIRPAIDPVGEARSNVSVFADLLNRFDLAQPTDPTDPDALTEALLRNSPQRDQLHRAFEANGTAYAYSTPFVDRFPGLPDQKIDLCPASLEEESMIGLYRYRPDPKTDRYPLSLISPAQAKTINSTMAQNISTLAKLCMHPVDAKDRRIQSDDLVRVYNAWGETRVHVSVTTEVRPGVVWMPKGLWKQHTVDGNSSNALCPDDLTDLGAGPVYNDTRVDIELADVAPN